LSADGMHVEAFDFSAPRGDHTKASTRDVID
jgi:hypothetical protein